MPLKPFAHLARVSFAKGVTHAYAPGVVAAGQSFGQIQNFPATAKVSKAASSLQHSFVASSGSSGTGAGAKAGHSSQAGSNDGGLAQYYAAWQHAQQTGDDTEWRKHQLARRIGWKQPEKDVPPLKQSHRLDSVRAVDLLRPSTRAPPTRTLSENAIEELQQAEHSFAEAEALARVDEAIAQEIKQVNLSRAAEDYLAQDEDTINVPTERVATPSVELSDHVSDSAVSSLELSSATDLTSPVVEEALTLSDQIIDLGQQQRYTDIPAIFEAIIKDGRVPTTDAYNYILLSAIKLSHGYQPWPRALEVYGDMTKRGVKLNEATYNILLRFLVGRSLEVHDIESAFEKRTSRYGDGNGASTLASITRQQQLYAGDTSLVFATKLYKIARATLDNFSLSPALYNALVRASAQSNMVEEITLLLVDMRAQDIALEPRLYTAIIDSYAASKDVASAQLLYENYRDLAIGRAANDQLDMHVYASLIKAYIAGGMMDTGLRFFEKILHSFVGTASEKLLSGDLTAAVVVRGLVQYQLDNHAFESALTTLDDYALLPAVKENALVNICITASDSNDLAAAEKAWTAIPPSSVNSETIMAIGSMYLRAGDIVKARSILKTAHHITFVPTTDFAAMHGVALINKGLVEEAIGEARWMFQQIRSAVRDGPLRNVVMAEIDETIVSFGDALTLTHAVVSPQTSVAILRAMIENGGFVSPVAEHAIASLGPDCIHQLNAQDIALSLHIQGQMLISQPNNDNIASIARFSHLLETIMDRTIPIDPSTVHIVNEALSKAGRPELSKRWYQLAYSNVQSSTPSVPMTPATPQTPFSPTISAADTFDPHAHTTDFRASKAISDLLESSSGRIENHLSDALMRLKNVRRAGRHVHYTTYAKLITAAGKAKQSSLISEIFGMARADVPFVPHVSSVRAGWVTIYDSMVAACLTVGERQLAAKYHQQLLDMGATASANTFGIYITTLEGTFDEATEAVKIFQRAMSEGVTPSVFLYNALIGKLGKARRIDDCLRYFGDMQNLGIRPSSVTYGTLVNALCRTSEESFAVEMFDEMESAPNYRPRPAPYNSIIQYFLNTKRDRSKVLQYYERMRSRNIKPTSHTYKLLIESYASLEPVNLVAAEGILADMKSAGIEPEAVHFGSLIHAKGCVMHDMAGARALFDSVLANRNIRPCDTLYQNLLEAMVANHEVAQTPEILEDMSRRRVPMTPYIANTLIHGWASEGDVAKAKSIYNSLGADKREPSTYEAMTRAFLSVEDHDGAREVAQEMLRKGYPAAVADKVLALVGNGSS